MFKFENFYRVFMYYFTQQVGVKKKVPKSKGLRINYVINYRGKGKEKERVHQPFQCKIIDDMY